ncbi:hypothetical protein [Prevotella sp. KH2C16]|uniref:hypothetical protein n=1 Tax=Prevotella sp. KH2C16 TaxID=1855325 RepID=UPI0008E6D6AA|nr:hypothetical protein [Prevotella sp. KH2C16]SFG41783.1 hypothetical protein SAMN05216383_11333 [Prevotella sp. KH2C16]
MKGKKNISFCHFTGKIKTFKGKKQENGDIKVQKSEHSPFLLPPAAQIRAHDRKNHPALHGGTNKAAPPTARGEKKSKFWGNSSFKSAV